MQLPLPLIKNVVFVGGGHAHALVLRAWAMNPIPGARLTLINPGPTAPYTGMLPGFIAGHYEREDLEIDLVRLARFADARLVLGSVTHIDRLAKMVVVDGRPPIPYDIVSIDVGITSAMPEIPGFTEFGTAAKPLLDYAKAWLRFVGEAPARSSNDVAVIGGGVGGCELAMAMRHRLSVEGVASTVRVLSAGPLLPDLGDKAREQVRARMMHDGIEVREGCRAVEVAAEGVRCDDGTTVAGDFVVGAAGARAYPWLSELGLATHEGSIEIDETLRSITDPSVFATGDCAHMGFAPRPKAGVFAVRQAPILLNNIQAELRGKRSKSFKPQDDYLKLISLGSKAAAADKFKQTVGGDRSAKALWRLKDKIDRDFMDKLGTDLEPMEPPSVPRRSVKGLRAAIEEEPPLCGGCGAKVGADVLAGPLAELPSSTRSDVVRLPGDDAALLQFGGVRQVITTDQLRPFTSDPFTMAKIASLHAMGDVWAMGAEPQAVLVTVTLPPLGPAQQGEWLREIMAGTAEALAGTGAEIVGGHTSMGAELSLGFSITGLVDGEPITLAGGRAGHDLMVTRPLGSGLLLAGEMQLRARGGDVAALLAELEHPQGEASAILARNGATAMTDITGFGLAGHLLNMCRASGVGATVDLDALPAFDGALDLAGSGLRAHLHTSNRTAVPDLADSDDPRAVLLFDPQTAGGFLAAVPSERTDAIAAALGEAGFGSWVVGSLVDGVPEITAGSSAG